MAQKIKRAAHEVQRPVFYSITIIITAYVPIFTLQRVEGRLFRPMAWTVAFALAGALLYSMFLGPVLASIVYPKGTKEWRNPIMSFLTRCTVRRWSCRAMALGDRGDRDPGHWRHRAGCSQTSVRNFCPTWTRARSGRAEPSRRARVRLRVFAS